MSRDDTGGLRWTLVGAVMRYMIGVICHDGKFRTHIEFDCPQMAFESMIKYSYEIEWEYIDQVVCETVAEEDEDVEEDECYDWVHEQKDNPAYKRMSKEDAIAFWFDFMNSFFDEIRLSDEDRFTREEVGVLVGKYFPKTFGDKLSFLTTRLSPDQLKRIFDSENYPQNVDTVIGFMEQDGLRP